MHLRFSAELDYPELDRRKGNNTNYFASLPQHSSGCSLLSISPCFETSTNAARSTNTSHESTCCLQHVDELACTTGEPWLEPDPPTPDLSSSFSTVRTTDSKSEDGHESLMEQILTLLSQNELDENHRLVKQLSKHTPQESGLH
jgi:hypothetical protein